MHSPLKDKPHPELQLVSALAKHLLSPSRFENSALLAQIAARDGLRCLAALDKPTQLSLPHAPEEPAAQAPRAPEAPQPSAPAQGAIQAQPATQNQAAAQPPAQAHAPSAASRFGTHKPEYQAGLEHPSVIEALLSYHSRTRVQGTAQAPLASFAPAQFAQVAAQPKKPFAHRPGTTRIFRPRGA